MYKITIYGFIFVWYILALSSALAWKLPIEVATYRDNGEKVFNRLVIGMEPDATDGFDNLWDAPALLSSYPAIYNPLLLRAYINGKDTGGDDIKHLWKDIRGPKAKGDTTWEINVDSVPAGKPVIIKWEMPQGILKGGEKLLLRDNGRLGSGVKPVQTEMIEGASYTFLPGDEGTRSLSLVLSKDDAKEDGSSRSDSGSGFGCGTIRPNRGGPPEGGMAGLGIVVLLLPLLFKRLLRFARNDNLSCHSERSEAI